MANKWLPSLPHAFLLLLLVANAHSLDERKLHVVYMGERLKNGASHSAVHHEMLTNVLGSASSAQESLVYSYGRSFNGLAARLTDKEAARFSEMESVVSVIPNTIFDLHTTRSWDFMGLPQDQYGHSLTEGDVIVGLLDTGLWPEAESFRDDGLGPPPAKWRGTCQSAGNFTCNNKVIGARFYNSDDSADPSDFMSPRDSHGHGSHTASTAAGRAVRGANYFGLANGTARGAVPGARIAVYKVCWAYGCGTADILAAFDDAIADGVDVISVSLGSSYPFQYFEDPIAIGAFHAMKKGILTSNSAGNAGPLPYSVANYAPWSLTVAASTIDRKFVSNVVLGNGLTFIGNAINAFELNGTTFDLIYGGDAPNVSAGASSFISRFCFPGTLNSLQVAGKIVLCDALSNGANILQVQGLGVIMSDIDFSTVFDDFSFSYPLPATLITLEDAARVLEYIQSTEDPKATILAGETWKDVTAPRVVSFSSRGPNPITFDILKPDVTAPGVDILAAWPPIAPTSIYPGDPRRAAFNVISGTSMSCPHASGAAAYVKSFHPTWSPAAIKSALMTTAVVMDSRKNEDAEFAYGSGHISPRKALDPGLVFDAREEDYVNFLCSQGYNTTTIRLVTGDSSACSSNATGKAWDLNYPSLALSVEDGQRIMGTFRRTVTNVGGASSTYTASVKAPSLMQVKVEPSVLSFTSGGETKSFTVTVTGGLVTQLPIASAEIVWTDGSHVVRTPLVVFTVLPNASPSAGTYQRMSRILEGSPIYRHN